MVSDLFGIKGMKFLKEVELQESMRRALDDYLEVLGILSKKINEVEGILREKAEVTEEAMWLMSIVGIGFLNALLALKEIGKIARFRNTKSLPENLHPSTSANSAAAGMPTYPIPITTIFFIIS